MLLSQTVKILHETAQTGENKYNLFTHCLPDREIGVNININSYADVYRNVFCRNVKGNKKQTSFKGCLHFLIKYDSDFINIISIK